MQEEWGAEPATAMSGAEGTLLLQAMGWREQEDGGSLMVALKTKFRYCNESVAECASILGQAVRTHG